MDLLTLELTCYFHEPKINNNEEENINFRLLIDISKKLRNLRSKHDKRFKTPLDILQIGNSYSLKLS